MIFLLENILVIMLIGLLFLLIYRLRIRNDNPQLINSTNKLFMIITPTVISLLTLNTLYTVKFATLQHTPDYIKVSADTGGLATLQYYDSTGSTLLSTVTTVRDSTAVWIIDLTQ